MDNRTSWIVGVVVVLVALAAAWYFFGGTAAPAPAPDNTPVQTGSAAANSQNAGTPAEQGIGTPAGAPIMVSYTNSGFSPATLTVKKGQSVKFTNNSSETMWVASNPHPSHTSYDGTSRETHCAAGYKGPSPFDECIAVNAGASYTFTFTKTGTWGYHNHANHNMFGTVTVTQ